MKLRPLSLVEIATVVFICLFNFNLLESWWSSPLERESWIPFVIWILPILAYRSSMTPTSSEQHSCPSLIGLGVFAIIAGIIGAVNTFTNIGLALALSGLIPWTRSHLLWIPAAISWMRPLGYMGSYYLGPYILVVRLVIVIPATFLLLYMLLRKERTVHEVT